jgi:FkbM family methyltransferase
MEKYDNIIHIGAHLCQEMGDYEKVCKGNIVWVEADTELFLRAQALIDNSKRHKIYNYFVTDLKKSKVHINIFNNDGASNSIYSPTRKMKKYWPKLQVLSSQTVRTITLNEIVTLANLSGQNNLLVLDVQGHELNVLKSGETGLKYFSKIICEISYVKLYKGAPTAKFIIRYLENQGFQLLNPNIDFHYDGVFARFKN